MNIIEFARKPYPISLNRWGIIISISLFISFFMVVFQPFGLQDLESEWKSILLAGYGLVTFVALFLDLIILQAILPGVFREENWTIFREIIYLAWIVITIAFGNYVYSDLLSIVHWVGIQGYLIFIAFTFAIAIIPIIGVTVTSHNRLLKKNLRSSLEMNQAIEGRGSDDTDDSGKLVISSENKNQQIEILTSNLICIESEGNYVNTWFLEEGKIVKLMIRNTLKNVESQVGNVGNLFKCHRAYIINLAHIEKVKGNSQGYRLLVKYVDIEIPVSRNYTKTFREAITRKH